MFCTPFKATMSVHACIRRQKWSKLYKKLEFVHDHSLITCQICDQGKELKTNPDHTLDQDFHILKNNQLKLIKDRGWVFKESIPLETLSDNYNYTQMKITKGVNNDSKRTNIKFNRQRGITRFVIKHRNITGIKQNIPKSIRIKLNTK